MNARIWIAAGVLTCFGALVACAAPRSQAQPRTKGAARKTPVPKKAPVAKKRPIATKAPATRSVPPVVLSPEDARMAVAMMGDAYDVLLEEIHETYHTRPSVPVAATVIRKVQERMTELGWPQARFLAVNAIVMHPNHVPRDTFERQAVEALRKGDDRIEKVVDGQLRVATVVSLGGRCTSCHWTPGAGSSKAATTWTVPLRDESEMHP